MNTPLPIFELKKVTKQFGSFQSLSNINLQIYPGESVALIGSSGAGKSTLISLLNRTLQPTEGEVWVLGRNLARLRSKQVRQVQRHIGTIYQQFHLVDNLQVIHNVNAGHLGRWSFLKAAVSLVYPLEVESAIKALVQVGIPEKLYERTDHLSGGEQQRVAIARVLVQDPAAILADEPISNLDPERGREIMNLLSRLSRESGKTLITSVHAFEYARSHFQRIIGLRQGRILFDAPPQEVSSSMVEEVYKRE
ncbi:phosphonate ABC transporter ATP-binding protein [Aetokthonos hydrillicola Thurmond2011]|jgi:phosphonate transport system ATP-binding protein|uniref:Phosphonate ABC transporter ATP-binding protein n=1 Tax=Aetokthonos hydrillicola Thurmond2011 TaxID=2712845 RepID=A0AAP5IG64_9CYAN|nr:phosphonate ABC transporter ATP-binding protein [Aetokthonos hydrillicola]MBO3462724.1 phosphonate ABC transporter ATP-binding protein [Aetokthonos hydrillicola CCALA 1050]MBW4585240.1 phosphonate ABC transporter ATP-binding protein [Aetokthonos hydrillicola CCALA 1050]MDR9899577.1 phosphonate ABC transporter ATP-binding protein [Aetokthonos hydrillicola Thurmond2011]